uniref:Uncharacterized protein n=1 Tax=Physcomitrium patens TaxID=3218 RepID=A0A2K1L0I2_PHYPA|nr:hypothetical protein PHYPA_002329 [Physcomitrium patens]
MVHGAVRRAVWEACLEAGARKQPPALMRTPMHKGGGFGTKRYLRRLRPVCARNGARVEVEELGVVRLKKREGRDNGEKLPEDLGLRLEIKAKAAAFISNAQSAKGGEGLLGQILAQVRVVRKQVLGASERRRIVLLGMQMRQAIKLNVHPDSSPYLRHRHPATQRGPQS